MDTQWINQLFQPSEPRPEFAVQRLFIALLVALIVGQLSAWVYRWTHQGVSYSRTFGHAIVLISVVAAISMSLVVYNPIIAIGLIGGLAIIRFRTVVRDARDMVFVFLSLICGMAAGFGFYGTAVIGAVAANLIALYLHLTGFGAWYSGEGMVRFRVEAAALDGGTLESQLRAFCRRFSVISIDETPSMEAGAPVMCQCAYKVRLKDPDRSPDFVRALKEICRADAVHLLVEQQNEEVA